MDRNFIDLEFEISKHNLKWIHCIESDNIVHKLWYHISCMIRLALKYKYGIYDKTVD